MEPNTEAREIDIKERTFPFIFQGLGFFLVKDGVPESELEEEPKNPRDISHLLKRDYKYEAFPFPNHYASNKATSETAPQQSNQVLNDTDSASPNADAPIIDENWPDLAEVMELSDDECFFHYNRLLGGDYPWERLNELVLLGMERKDMDIDDFREWREIWKLHSRFRETKIKDANNIEDIRYTVHDILIWTLVLDYYYDVPEADSELLKKCTESRKWY